jgi:hypothetical protein
MYGINFTKNEVRNLAVVGFNTAALLGERALLWGETQRQRTPKV